MKRKFFSLMLMAVAAMSVSAQNVQLHYDFGRNIYSNEEAGRQKVTLTLEQFKADKWGSWFYFVDLDLNRKETMAAYAEISREINIGKQGFAAHFEYDGGLSSSPYVGSYQQAALLGGAWNGHSSDFSKTYGVQLMYKRFFKNLHDTHAYNSFQLTGVWGLNFAQKKCTFSGFIDFWRGEKDNGHGQLVILSEPQFWYNVTDNLSLGSEVEISNNFIYNADPTSSKTFFINPTLAVKWNF
ncbi:DUF5020 family protein [Prevotella sp. P6B1]|uniref:nucleoside-specific channel-forming Tsx family protein n=1 Tax=Prevotella sp. P6B1 TaxID=1410613 RepID=UPI00051BDA27|nr:DUF5020 family protein [Prevotella sp. P6B1]